MKRCLKCGTINKDESSFCVGCGQSEFNNITDQTPPAIPGMLPPAPVQIQKKPEFKWPDILTIFAFVASLVGCAVIPLILNPF